MTTWRKRREDVAAREADIAYRARIAAMSDAELLRETWQAIAEADIAIDRLRCYLDSLEDARQDMDTERLRSGAAHVVVTPDLWTVER